MTLYTSIGFTGSRKGMTRPQANRVLHEIAIWSSIDKPWNFHHGACIGSDEEAAELASRYNNARIIAHPGRSQTGGAEFLSVPSLAMSHEKRNPKHYFARNRDIVSESQLLIAAPSKPGEMPKRTGGGTWFTIHTARGRGIPVVIVWPDGGATRTGFKDERGAT